MKLTREHTSLSFIKPIFDLTQLTIGDVVMISHAHKLENGRYSCYSFNSYHFINITDSGYNFINTEYEHEGYYTKDIHDHGDTVEGVIIDKVFLRRLKIIKLLKNPLHEMQEGKHDF